jgi:hypothetical protein
MPLHKDRFVSDSLQVILPPKLFLIYQRHEISETVEELISRFSLFTE